jgi:hypothetical protein
VHRLALHLLVCVTKVTHCLLQHPLDSIMLPVQRWQGLNIPTVTVTMTVTLTHVMVTATDYLLKQYEIQDNNHSRDRLAGHGNTMVVTLSLHFTRRHAVASLQHVASPGTVIHVVSVWLFFNFFAVSKCS